MGVHSRLDTKTKETQNIVVTTRRNDHLADSRKDDESAPCYPLQINLDILSPNAAAQNAYDASVTSIASKNHRSNCV